MPPYSMEFLTNQATIRWVERYGELKEETYNRRVYLRSEVIVEENIDGNWQVTEIYVPA